MGVVYAVVYTGACVRQSKSVLISGTLRHLSPAVGRGVWTHLEASESNFKQVYGERVARGIETGKRASYYSS